MSRRALSTLIGKAEIAVVVERANERAMIADVVKNGARLPADHWRARHRAEERLRTLRLIDDVLAEAS